MFGPGTYYLVLAGYGGATGPATIRFQHLPTGGGTIAFANPGSGSYGGATSGANQLDPNCRTSTGPENLYWWKTCPGAAGGLVTATTCSRASGDTVLQLYSPDNVGDVCVDDSCGLQSTVSGTVSGAPGLHAVFVDGYAGASGSYTVQITRP